MRRLYPLRNISILCFALICVSTLTNAERRDWFGDSRDSYDDYSRDRDRYEIERERDRLDDERYRLEREREELRRERMDQNTQKNVIVEEHCPSGFTPSEQKCSQDERRRGCKDIRLPGGLGCVRR